jgi:hypothetical protein
MGISGKEVKLLLVGISWSPPTNSSKKPRAKKIVEIYAYLFNEKPRIIQS